SSISARVRTAGPPRDELDYSLLDLSPDAKTLFFGVARESPWVTYYCYCRLSPDRRSPSRQRGSPTNASPGRDASGGRDQRHEGQDPRGGDCVAGPLHRLQVHDGGRGPGGRDRPADDLQALQRQG